MTAATRPTTVLNIDRVACDGRGICAELLPELLDLDDWGYPIVHVAVIPAHLEDLARRAVDACPVMAFRLYHDPSLASKVTGRRR
jgi:ferredoxin